MLSEEQKEQFKKQLLEMKEEAEADLERYQRDQKETNYPNNYTDELSSIADHPGDLGTDQHEREKEQTFYEQARERLMEINDALRRMEEGRYGLSEKSGEPIPIERLEVMPTARVRVDEVE